MGKRTALKSNRSNRTELTNEEIEQRNEYLKMYFSKLEQDIRLIGHIKKPTIVVNDLYCISAHVHKYNLFFTDKIYDGNVLTRLRLIEGMYISQDTFNTLLKQMERKMLYKIQYKDTNLYLSGYNFRNREQQKGKYPVFSQYNYKLYFKKQNAEEVMNEFPDYPLVLM